MSSSPEASLANGDNSPSAEPPNKISLDERLSESDLSEVNETAALQSSPSPSPSPSSNHRESPQPADPESDESDNNDNDNEDNNTSDDADFGMASPESPAPSQSDGPQDRRSSSNDSRRVPKRKAVAEEDEYIRENPELYGLRRSVC